MIWKCFSVKIGSYDWIAKISFLCAIRSN